MQAPPPQQPQQPIQQPYYADGATPGMQQAPMPVSQVPMSTINTVHQQAVYPEVDANGCKKSGGMQMVVGSLIFIFGIVSVCIDCEYSYFGTAIWGGIWDSSASDSTATEEQEISSIEGKEHHAVQYTQEQQGASDMAQIKYMIGGFVGASAVRASGSSANCQLTGYLVLNIFSIIYAFDLLVTMSVAIGQEEEIYHWNHANVFVTSSRGARIAIDSILLTLSILEIFAACWGTGVASKTVCGTRQQTVVTSQPIQVAYTTTTTTPGYYANQPAAMSVTTQYAFVNQSGHPGPSMPQQPGAVDYPPPAYEKKPLGQP